jgi:site-specific DNA-methyltransferase (adenine-specific)
MKYEYTDRCNITLHNGDCMDGMKDMPDNAFDLAIVDPPYGIGDIIRHSKGGGQLAENFNDGKDLEWNSKIPDKQYFCELSRVSTNQIIWGGNYFAHLMDPSRCWIAWDKKNGGSSFADIELAWTSFDRVAKIFRFRWSGMLQENMGRKERRIHPTQKPVELYKWLLKTYAKPGQTIIDTHLGSGSIAIACHDLKYDLVGYELDADYYASAVNRFKNHSAQLLLF